MYARLVALSNLTLLLAACDSLRRSVAVCQAAPPGPVPDAVADAVRAAVRAVLDEMRRSARPAR